MAFACNIDGRGRVVRLGAAVVCLAAALGLAIAWAWPTGSLLAWGLSVTALLSAALGFFSARRGWCMMRAMGFRTPI